MRIKMLKPVGDYAKGAIVPVDEAVGNRYILGGYAEEVPGDGGTETADTLSEVIKAAVAQGYAQGRADADGTAPLTAEEKAARFRVDPGEQQADREKSFSDFIKQVIIVGCPNLLANGKLPFRDADATKAAERLDKVYKSGFREFETKDLYEGSGTAGGYTVAPLYVQELLKLAAEESVVRPFANVKTLPGREAYFPMLNQSTAPTAGQTAYFGGVNMQWTGEAQPRPTAEPNFKQVHVQTHELAGLAKLSRTLLSDNMIGLETELRQLFAGAIAWAEDYAFLQGDGNAKPKGILNEAATITFGSRATSDEFKLADAANMMGSMMPQSRPKAVWVMINTLFSYLVQLADSTGRVTYIPNVGTGYNDAKLAMGQLLLFGRPVVFTEKLPTLGTAGDVLCADFSKYIVADTGTLEIAASDQYAFNTNQITFRVIKRVDGKAQIDGPFTMSDATTTISSFVILHA